MAKNKFALDAGHGKNTAGKRCMKSLDPAETREWVLNARVCNYIEQLLQEYEDVEVLRVDDTTGKVDVGLTERATKANSWGATFYFAVHHDGGANGSSSGGVTVFRYTNSKMTTDKMLTEAYNAIVSSNELKGNRAQPVRQANYTVLAKTNMPAMYLENGFMDSKMDTPIILTEEHALKTAQGVVNYLVAANDLKKKSGKTVDNTQRKVKILVDNLPMYEKMSTKSNILQEIKDKGTYTVLQTVTASSGNVWCKCKYGWIRISTTKKVFAKLI